MNQGPLPGDGTIPERPPVLPRPGRQAFLSPENYRPDPQLINAANVALTLGQPLLLTGEPGTGKSQLAYFVARMLHLEPLLKFETKSTSTSESLFYHYDALKRFQQAQAGTGSDTALPYISYSALGKAILLSNKPEDVKSYLPDDFEHPGQKRSVVLIDEIDKAPRDFPNDILNELDNLYFRVRELDNQPIKADRDLQPVVIMTSNSEKDLPDAFLRRCIFYHIPFPDAEQMKRIVESRLGSLVQGADPFLDDALDLFYTLRKTLNRKKPSTSELLEWVMAIRTVMPDDPNPLASRPELALETISALSKAVEDQPRAMQTVSEWIQSRTTS